MYGGKEAVASNVLIGAAFAQFLGLVLYKIQVVLRLRENIVKLKLCLNQKRKFALECSDNWERAPILAK